MTYPYTTKATDWEVGDVGPAEVVNDHAAALNDLKTLLGTTPVVLERAAQLKAWTVSEAYQMTAITRDADGVITTATVSWPDGSAGTYTVTTFNTTWDQVDAYTVSHTNWSLTATQAAVTRNGDGLVTARPVVTVA